LGNLHITIQGNGIVKTLTITKHLESEIIRPKMLLCYNYHNGITNEEKNIIFATKPKLFSIGTISLPETIQFMKTTDVVIIDTNVKINISKHGYDVLNTKKRIPSNGYELEIALEDKVYQETYYRHQLENVVMDETLAKNKA